MIQSGALRIGQTIVTTMLLACLSAGAVAQSTTSELPSARDLNRMGLEIMWWGTATIDPGRATVKHVVIDEESVFVQSSSGIVTAFDSETGQKMWSAQTGRFDAETWPVTANEESVIIVTGMEISSVDRRTGTLQWRLNTTDVPSATPAIDRHSLYVGMLDGSVYAYDLSTVRQLFRDGKIDQFIKQAELWRYKASQQITSAPIVTGRIVSFASLDGQLYTVTSKDRSLQYQFETDAPILAPLAGNGKILLLASKDYNFYCLNGDNGKVRWSFASGRPISYLPILADDQVVVIPERAGMSALSLADGRPQWPRPVDNVVRYMSASPSMFYVVDRGGNMLAVDRKTGEVVHSMPLRGFTVDTINQRTDRVVLASTSGLVVACQPIGGEFPRYYRYPELRPLTPTLFREPNAETPAADAASPTGGEPAPESNPFKVSE